MFFLPPFFMSWTQRSKTFSMYTKGLFPQIHNNHTGSFTGALCKENIQDGGERGTDDLCSCVHCPLEGLAFCCTTVPVLDSDAAGQHALNGSPVESGFYCTRQMADSVYGVMWVSGLLMSTLWIKWPTVAMGLWYGQAYVMDNEHRCILLIAFWMHRDTTTRSWGPLLCHSSTTITSCCSMIK